MSRNEGNTDRILRGALGLALLGLAVGAQLTNPYLVWGAIVVGGVLLLTAVTGFCPAYRLLGLKTCQDC